MKITKAIITAAGRKQQTLPLQTLISTGGCVMGRRHIWSRCVSGRDRLWKCQIQ